MSYIPPSYSSINFNFTKSYTPPSYNLINLEFVQNILDLDSKNLSLATSPVVLTRSYKLNITASSFIVTASTIVLKYDHKLNVNSSNYSLILSNVGYGNIIRNLTSSYNLTLNQIGLTYSKVPISINSSSFVATLNNTNLAHNYKIDVSTTSSALTTNAIDLTYTPVSDKISLVLTEVLLGLNSIGFYRTHAPLNLSTSVTELTANPINYRYNRVLSVPPRSFYLSSFFSLKCDRIGTILTNNSSLTLLDIGITSSKKLSIVDIPITYSSNNVSFLYTRSLALSSSISILSLQDTGLRNNKVFSIDSNNSILTSNNIAYKYYRLDLNNSPIVSHLQNIISKHNYLLNLQSSSTSLSIQDIVVMVLEPFTVEEVLVLVGDTNTLLSTEVKENIIPIANTSIIDTTHYPKLIETLEDKLLSTTHKVTLINITSKD